MNVTVIPLIGDKDAAQEEKLMQEMYLLAKRDLSMSSAQTKKRNLKSMASKMTRTMMLMLNLSFKRRSYFTESQRMIKMATHHSPK